MQTFPSIHQKRMRLGGPPEFAAPTVTTADICMWEWLYEKILQLGQAFDDDFSKMKLRNVSLKLRISQNILFWSQNEMGSETKCTTMVKNHNVFVKDM